MKKSALSFNAKIITAASLLLLVFSGCKKDNVTKLPAVDKFIFFTIKIDGVNYTSYGYLNDSNTDPWGGPTLTHILGEGTFPSPFITTITLTASNVYQSSSSPSSGPLELGNCELHLVLQKDGPDLIYGDYTRLASGPSEQSIIDRNNEVIYFSGTSMKLNIDRVIKYPQNNNVPLVEGTISCLVYKSSDPGKNMPASGSFRMYSR